MGGGVVREGTWVEVLILAERCQRQQASPAAARGPLRNSTGSCRGGGGPAWTGMLQEEPALGFCDGQKDGGLN